MRLRRYLKKLSLAAGLILLGLLVVWLSLPVWFPWVLGPLARRDGARYAGYERAGYTRFVLRDFSFTNQTTRFHAGRVEALAPNVWLWRHLVGTGKEPRLFLSVTNWQLELVSSGQKGGSTYQDVQEWSARLRSLRRWLPDAALSQGSIQTDYAAIAAPAAYWTNGHLSAELEIGPRRAGPGTLAFGRGAAGHGEGKNAGTDAGAPSIGAPSAGVKVSLQGDLGQGPPFAVRLQSSQLQLQSTIRLVTDASGFEIQSTNLWWTNRIILDARFGREGTLPERAALLAPSLLLPGWQLELPEYPNINGSASARWEHGQFVLDLTAAARPFPLVTDYPPIDVDLHARGDTASATIESAVVTLPWLKARLTKAARLNFTGELLREPADLILAADLSRQPWLPLSGVLNGEARFRPSNGRFPEAWFRLDGAGLGTEDLKTSRFALEGGMHWPWVEISQARADFPDGSTATVNGRMDLLQKEVDAAHVAFDGPLLRRWLPPGYSMESVSLTAEASGPLKNLVHRGQVKAAQFASPELRPVDVRTTWSGRQMKLDEFDVNLSAGRSSLQLRGALEAGAWPAHLLMTTLSLRTNGQPLLELAQPCRVSFQPGSPRTAPWRVASTPFDWAGPGGEVHLQANIEWPREGNLKISLSNLHAALLSNFLQESPGEVAIQRLAGSAGWTNGPVTFSLDLAAAGALAGKQRVAELGNAVEVTAKLAGNSAGLTLSNLAVSSPATGVSPGQGEQQPAGAAPLVVAHGFLPMTFHPAKPADFIHFDYGKALRLEAKVNPQAFVWETLAEQTGIALREPNLDLRLEGSWDEPQGRIHLRARQIQYRSSKATLAGTRSAAAQAALEQLPMGKVTLPSLDSLDLDIVIDHRELRIAEGQLFVQGHRAMLTGAVPLGQDFLGRIRKKEWPDWQAVSARLRVPDAELASFAELYPKLLAPQGLLDVDLSLQPGGKLAGGFLVQGARTRPLPDVGPVRDINIKAVFHERSLELQTASAHIGPAPVLLTGHADLQPLFSELSASGFRAANMQLPPFRFVLRGTNVPLSRQPESIIRSDLDLVLTSTNGAPPLISGSARLRDSFLLSDLRPLAPGKVAVPSRRPPYFSIDDPLLADWRLAVRVTGERFLKVRSTVFNGAVSANLNLQGTLKDPMALGDVKIASGTVRFPFASLEVQQGLVTLSSQDPYRPQLAISATSKQFGYDIKMEATGPADTPVIQFSSSPPLSSEQILLLVTAGEVPQEGVALSTQQRAQALGMFLGRDVLARLGFGDQAEERLTIRSGEEISQQGKPTYSVEYKISPRWSVVGEYDRFNDFNVGLKWRVYSK